MAAGIAVDYSGSYPGASALQRAGVVGVIRYVSGGSSGKHLTGPEAADLLKHGIAIAAVNESGTTRARQGYNAGHADALAGLAAFSATIGHAAPAIYLTDDSDSYGAGQLSSVVQYFRGARDAIGAGRVGVYGGYYTVKAVLDAGFAKLAWQSIPAWSRGHSDGRANLYQELSQPVIGGTQCDLDVIRTVNWGQYPPPGPVKPPTPPPPFTGPWIRDADQAFHMV